jgi:hypothetical protein
LIFRKYSFLEKLDGKDRLKIQAGEERIILGCVILYWFHLAQDWGQGRDIVNTAMNLRIP